MRAAALGVEEALEMLRKRREEIRRADAERGKRAEEDSEEDGNGSLLSEGVVVCDVLLLIIAGALHEEDVSIIDINFFVV